MHPVHLIYHDQNAPVSPSIFERRVTVDSALFYIDWSDIQVRLNRPDFFSYAANAGKARNIGVENTVMWRPDEHLELQVNATYLDAEIAQTLDLGNGTVVPKGSTLPGASRWTTAELATYRWTNDHSPYLSLSHRFVSSALSGFAASTGGAVPVGNYSAFDLRAGLNLGQFALSAYFNNIANKRGITAGQVAGPYVQDFYIRPRTVGIQLDWRM